jgi:hypothetical protein
MVAAGLFTRSDLAILGKAASVAELLTQKYFNFGDNEWKRNPYAVFTRKYVTKNLYEDFAFANVIRYGGKPGLDKIEPHAYSYGIVLQDPVILLELLRSSERDLWTMGLFVLTHELIHIVRFREFGADFFACAHDRDKEERLVHGITRDMLSGMNHMAPILNHYQGCADEMRAERPS